MTKAGRLCSWPYDDFDIIAWATATADSAPAKTTNFLDVISIAISLLASTSIGDARNERARQRCERSGPRASPEQRYCPRSGSALSRSAPGLHSRTATARRPFAGGLV